MFATKEHGCCTAEFQVPSKCWQAISSTQQDKFKLQWHIILSGLWPYWPLSFVSSILLIGLPNGLQGWQHPFYLHHSYDYHLCWWLDSMIVLILTGLAGSVYFLPSPQSTPGTSTTTMTPFISCHLTGLLKGLIHATHALHWITLPTSSLQHSPLHGLLFLYQPYLLMIFLRCFHGALTDLPWVQLFHVGGFTLLPQFFSIL